MTLVTMLLGLVGPLGVRLLAAFGVGLITLSGFTAAVNTLKTSVLDAVGGLPAASVQLLGLFGVWEALGMYFGAITFIITWRTTKGFMAFAKVPG